jgi:PAS domain S-box-containing protein
LVDCRAFTTAHSHIITMKILLIEDNLGDAVLVQEYLQDADLTLVLVHATSLQDAAKLLEHQEFKAILLDLSLPDTQGLDTVRRIRQIAPNIPIVVMSGINDRETAVSALQHGAQDFLVKGHGEGDYIFRALKYAIERHDLLSRLETSNAQLELSSELALNAARMVAWIWQAKDDSLTLSSNAKEILGSGATWISTQSLSKAIHPEDLAAHQGIARQALIKKEGYQSSYRLWNETKNDYIWVEEYGVVRLDAKGEIMAVNGVAQDMTERKQADLTLRRIVDAQKRFVSDAAHELRAPLTSIQGNLELLRRYPNMTDTDRNETTEDAYREAIRLGRLVKDLLALARGDAQQELNLEPVALHDLIKESLRHAQHLSQTHRIELTEITNCIALADYDRLKQLMLILLENAIKYTPSGGWIKVSLTCDPDWAEICVQDSGIGIAAENIPHVFELFYRADKGRSRGNNPGDTGLGLPIAQWIVAQHGGEIRLESELGFGTKAKVRLRVA